MPRSSAARVVCALLTLLPTAAGAQALPEPAALVKRADVERILGGVFEPRSPEPGVLFYEESAGSYRAVHVYVQDGAGRRIADLRAHFESQGEPIEEIAGVGEAAMYRPQDGSAMAEATDAAGVAFVVTVAIRNVDQPEAARHFASELVKLVVKAP